MEVFKPFISIVVVVSVLQIVKCALPSDTVPAEWKMHLEVPIVNKKYVVNDVIPEDLFPGLDVVYTDSANQDDTVSVVKKGQITNVIEKQLFTVDTGIIENELGPIILQKTPDVKETFLIGSGISGGGYCDEPLPFDARLDFSKEKHIEGLKWITIDESSEKIVLTVENSTEKVLLEDISVVLSNQNDTIAVENTNRIPPRSSKEFQIALAGKRLQFPLVIGVEATISAGTIVRPTDGISIFFSFNQQKVSEAVLNDSFIKYSQCYSSNVMIADLLLIEAIDLDTTILYFDIAYPTLMKLEVKGTLENAWKCDYAVSKHIQCVKQLNSKLDSAQFAGALGIDTLFEITEQDHYRKIKRVQPMRIFPSWDGLLNKSFITFNMSLSAIPEDRMIHYCKNDSIKITMVVSRLPFDRISGFFVRETQVTYTEKMKIGFDWKPSITNPMKKMFRFNNARLDFKLTSDLPFGSRIDSMQVNIVMHDLKKNNDSASVKETFYSISSDSVHSARMNFTNVFNSWPDSVEFDTRFILPSKTGVILRNSDERNSEFNEPLVIKMIMDWCVSVPLCWKVVETIVMELDTTRFSLDEEQIEWIEKLSEPKVRINVDIGNYTNVGFRLHALGAKGVFKDALMACPDSLVGDNEYIHKNNLFPLFDKNGLHVKSRGKKTSVVLQMDKNGIDALLSEDGCLIRWFLTIPSKKNDALHATDYWTIQAMGIIEGIGNSDSLLYMTD